MEGTTPGWLKLAVARRYSYIPDEPHGKAEPSGSKVVWKRPRFKTGSPWGGK